MQVDQGWGPRDNGWTNILCEAYWHNKRTRPEYLLLLANFLCFCALIVLLAVMIAASSSTAANAQFGMAVSQSDTERTDTAWNLKSNAGVFLLTLIEVSKLHQ